MNLKWLEWAQQIQAISQNGLAYSKDVYDLERFEQLRNLSITICNEYTDVETDKIRTLFASEFGYATPKVDVRGVVFQNDEILLVKERLDGAWSLPGGWADIGLSPREVVIKEIKEESGYDVRTIRLLGIMDTKFHDHPPSALYVYKIYILCEIIGGDASGGVETSEVKFFKENQLPALSVERVTEKQIKELFKFIREPDKEILLD
ncbi:NUDIX hydrolase [Paenibacillus glacialis]|uniref:ADP-ribose pyrophosphatase n=1 Tax=Paenibacillus glacialis TaxID=494026 RepID=A0A162MFT4_9BACL|nr:NUDIX hydrolase [Paenibacillus glacialis]OAB43773.1 ADP-ribose pyrophosphatase [Paenibacillus glacialis]